MPTINNIEFLTLPQQVNKNKEDVRVLQDGVANLNDEIILKANTTLVNTKADKIVLTNLVSNGDLTIAKPSPNQNQPEGFNYSSSTTNITLINGIATFTPTAQNASMLLSDTSIFNTNDKYYRFARVKSTSANFGFILPSNFYTNVGEWEFISSITSGNISVVSRLYEQKSSGFTPIEVDYIGAINLTAIFGKDKEPTTEQMNLILRYTGFFESKELNLVDVFKITAAPTQEEWITPTLTNAVQDPTYPFQYMKDSLGFVHFRGKLTRTAAGTGILFLPNGYKAQPGITSVFSTAIATGGVGNIQLSGGQQIYCDYPSTANLVFHMNGISYKAEA